MLVEVGGVGYRVQAGPATAARLGDVGAEVFVWIHHHVREDADTLYGFASPRRARRASRRCSAPTASARRWPWPSSRCTSPTTLRRVLADDDVAALCLVPGVGKKTAARLLVELKSRLDLPDRRAGRRRRLDGDGASAGQRRRPGPTCATRSSSLGYGARGDRRGHSATLPDGDDAASCSRRRCASSPRPER